MKSLILNNGVVFLQYHSFFLKRNYSTESMTKYIFIFLFIWAYGTIAQNTFEPGYIISLEKDSIKGFILNRSDAELAKGISYRKNQNAIIQKFTPDKLKGFGFDTQRNFEGMNTGEINRQGDSIFIFAKNMLRGKIEVFVWRKVQKRTPDVFLENTSTLSSLHLHRAKDTGVIAYEEFLQMILQDSSRLNGKYNVHFREKKLLRDIAAYNNEFSPSSISVYKEEMEWDTDLLAGLPFNFSNDLQHFRIGIYINKTRPERTSNFSVLRGVIYHHRQDNNIQVQSDLRDGAINQKWQVLNLVPWGIKFKSNTGTVRPYGYLGAGVAILRETNVNIENFVVKDPESKWVLFPTVNTGMGVAFKIGNTYLLTEITPTINNVFLNIGFSI